MSVSDRTTSVDERCTIVTSASPSHSAAAMSWAELLEPMTTALRPRYASGPGCCDEWCWSPSNRSMPGKSGRFGHPDMPVATTRCSGRRVSSSPSRSTTTSQTPAASSKVARRQVVEPQKLTSMTRTYISSQSAILSLGEKTGQFAGNSR
jgi:hypothetical protein